MESGTAKISQMLHLHTAPIACPGCLPDVSMASQPSWIAEKPSDRFCYLSMLIAFGAWGDGAGAIDL
jgi:hypothetical protein